MHNFANFQLQEPKSLMLLTNSYFLEGLTAVPIFVMLKIWQMTWIPEPEPHWQEERQPLSIWLFLTKINPWWMPSMLGKKTLKNQVRIWFAILLRPITLKLNWRKKLFSSACCDVALTVAIPRWDESVKDDVTQLVKEEGINSFKVYMAFKNELMLTNEELLDVFDHCKSLGAIVHVHAENGTIIAENEKRLRAK